MLKHLKCKTFPGLLSLILIGLIVAGCSQSLYMQGRKHLENGEYREAAAAFYGEIEARGKVRDAWRELGVTFYEEGALDKAEEALKQATAIKPDARTQLYLGLIYEKREDYERAVDAYAGALAVGASGSTRSRLEAHLDRLVIRKIQAEADRAISQESQIEASKIPGNSIAVPPFDVSNLPPDLAPIGRGLADMTASDLGKVRDLQVVERLKIDAIMNELALSQSGLADRTIAPRVGRLAGGRRLITGSLVAVGDEGVRIDGAVVDVVDSSTARTQAVEGGLQQFFRIQKDFVFGVIDRLGITLTKQERDAINEVPTEDYLAFMAYCRGLDYESRGQWSQASQEYQQAASADPGFSQAGSRATTAGRMASSTYSESQVGLESATQAQGTPMAAGQNLDLRLSRVRDLGGPIPNNRFNRLVLAPPGGGTAVRVTIQGELNGLP